MLSQLTRRGLLARGLVAAAGLVVGWPARASFAAPKRRAVYVLDPEALNRLGCPGCAACPACLRHGANKLFESRAAADAHRAHPNCNCAIQKAGELPTAVWFALFGPTQGTAKAGSVDRRHEAVAQLLAPHAAALA
jgi:hypothetical protein